MALARFGGGRELVGIATMSSRVAFIKTSLIDFPGRLASVLFLPGCNFRCPYCHNAGLVDERQARVADELVEMGEFLEFLDRRRALVSGVVISGGEPLLHGETPRIAARSASAAWRSNWIRTATSPNG